MHSSVQPFIYPSFSLQFIVTSSHIYRSDILVFAHSLSFSPKPSVRPFSHSSFSLRSIFSSFVLLSMHSHFIHPAICPLPLICVTNSASTLLFTQFIDPPFILQSTFHLISLLIRFPFSYPSIYLPFVCLFSNTPIPSLIYPSIRHSSFSQFLLYFPSYLLLLLPIHSPSAVSCYYPHSLLPFECSLQRVTCSGWDMCRR